jgi:hypothetical protein
MKKTICKILVLCLALIALIQPTRRAAAYATSDAGNAYGLGVNMGFASFQTSVSGVGKDGQNYWRARDALIQARAFANQIKSSAPTLNVAALDSLISTLAASAIVTTRGEYSGTLWKTSKQMGNAYDLGVAISIAEGQATAGEDARSIVRSSLVSAQAPATNLGLPANDLTSIIAQIDQGVAFGSIYGKITYVRGKYQSLLSALQPVVTGPKVATGKGAVVDADTVLLKRGCTRPGPGTYSCPTIAAYEACEIYRNQGVVKACATSANEKVQAAMDKLLFSVGCSRFLGRPDEFLCKTQKGLDLCETYRKNGKLKKCTLTK